jgi:hypothetical protein
MVIIHEIRPNLFLKRVKTARVRWLASTAQQHGAINTGAPFVDKLATHCDTTTLEAQQIINSTA